MAGETWIAFAMAALALMGNIFAAINARKTARDKLDHEIQLKELDLKQSANATKLAEVEVRLRDCQEQHTKSEADRVNLHNRAEAAEKTAAGLKGEVDELKKRLPPVT